MQRPAALYNRRKWQLIGKSQWCCSANCGHPLHALTYKWTRGMQLANTPQLQSTTPGLHPVTFHQMAPPVRGNAHPITAYYSVYRPRKDERLSRPVPCCLSGVPQKSVCNAKLDINCTRSWESSAMVLCSMTKLYYSYQHYYCYHYGRLFSIPLLG